MEVSDKMIAHYLNRVGADEDDMPCKDLLDEHSDTTPNADYRRS